MDRSKCWVTTQVSIIVEHCPSNGGEIGKEVDRIINFAMKGTDLTRFGKAHVQVSHSTPAQTSGD